MVTPLGMAAVPPSPPESLSWLAPDWAACAGSDNPFVQRGFFEALLESGSATSATGWVFTPHVVRGQDGSVIAAAPVFQKAHSWGEYVFDHAWAQAWERAGGRYYPKLLVGVPFTPVPGPRLLVRPEAPADTRDRLIAGIEASVAKGGLSSAHATFLEADDRAAFEARGWILRAGYQFHFNNPGFTCFEEFLSSLTSHRRKDIRRERRIAQASGLRLRTLRGTEITGGQWAQFHGLYLANSDRKWGQAYLGPSFFARMAEKLGDKVLLTVAEDGETLVAAALHLRGKNTLYGRNWGALKQVPFLHFELCYYMALDLAFAEGIERVEAGAQGEHKLQRGYLPALTWSAHYLPVPSFKSAVAAFCADERARVEEMVAGVDGPFRQPSGAG